MKVGDCAGLAVRALGVKVGRVALGRVSLEWSIARIALTNMYPLRYN